jgi:prophage regulatory protein
MNDDATSPPQRLIRLADVCQRVGLGKTMIYAMIGDGRFPKPYKITPAAARWSEQEIEDWVRSIVMAVPKK